MVAICNGHHLFSAKRKTIHVNFRVHDLENLLQKLAAEAVTIVGDMESSKFRKFSLILDSEGNKIELWKPIDAAFQ